MLICLHTLNDFNNNNFILQLNDLKFKKIIKYFYLAQRLILVRVDLGVMAMKGYSSLDEATSLGEGKLWIQTY